MRLRRHHGRDRQPKPSHAAVPVGPGRLEAFSDGVMAIAITLLSLELSIPDVEEGLLHALTAIWPQYVGFALSFLLIGQVWLNHHAIFSRMSTVNQRVLVWNLFLLLDVAFLPFATRVLTRCLESGTEAAVGSIVYGGAMFVGGLCFNALWMAAIADRTNVKQAMSQVEIDAMTRRFRRGPVLYALASGVGALNIWLAVTTYVILIVYYMFDSGSK